MCSGTEADIKRNFDFQEIQSFMNTLEKSKKTDVFLIICLKSISYCTNNKK